MHYQKSRIAILVAVHQLFMSSLQNCGVKQRYRALSHKTDYTPGVVDDNQKSARRDRELCTPVILDNDSYSVHR